SSEYEKAIAFRVVPVVGYFPFSLDVGELAVGSNRSAELVVWTETRDRLNIKGRVLMPNAPEKDEPCAEFGAPVEMSKQEVSDLPKQLGDKFGKLSPRAAYRMKVTVFERRGD